MTMKPIPATPSLAALLALGITSNAIAFTYTPGDVLLVFRKDGLSANDVEFNLGSIDQFLQATNGATLNITNWDKGLVTDAYSFTDDGIGFALVAATTVNATNRSVWLTSAEPNTVPLDRTPSQWQQLWSKVDAVGNKPAEYTLTNSAPSISVAPTLYPSYTYIASNGNTALGLISKIGGASTFNVQADTAKTAGEPASLKFYQIRPSTASTKPQSALLGTFKLTAAGELTYTAGGAVVNPPTVTQIVSTAATGGTITVAFKTVAGTQYRLRYNTSLQGSPGSWTAGADTVAGTGANATLTDAAPAGTERFYVVESFQ